MEQHAVPQDITGFKFKLVGDMTLKQFGELAGGAVVAYLFYATSWPAVIKWPFVLIFGFLGFALAFLPIEERPLDIWIANFFKAIYKPTLFVWKKGVIKTPVTMAATIPVTTSSPTPVTPTVVVQDAAPQLWPYTPPKDEPKEESKKENSVFSIEDLQKLRDNKIKELEDAVKKLEDATKPKVQTPTPPSPTMVTIDDLAKLRDDKKIADENQLKTLTDQNKVLDDQIKQTQTKIQALTGSDTSQLQSQLDNLQKQKLEIGTQISGFNKPNDAIKVVEKIVPKQETVSLTDLPNIINGTVLNQSGVPLDGTILIIKDKAGNSIRALKSNQIGQFIASTPLENGSYYLEFERQGYNFDVLELTIDGKVITPLQIYAKN